MHFAALFEIPHLNSGTPVMFELIIRGLMCVWFLHYHMPHHLSHRWLILDTVLLTHHLVICFVYDQNRI